MAEESTSSTVELATELTIAWLGNQHNRIAADDVPAFLLTIHQAVEQLRKGAGSASEDGSAEAAGAGYEPAVSARKSLASRDHILSMIDGKPYRSLRRHLTSHGLTPDQYRARYKLKSDYPMVAPGYSEQRRETAKRLGLGRKPKAAATTSEAAPAPKPKRGSRKKTEATA